MYFRSFKCRFFIGSAIVLGVLLFFSARLFAEEKTVHLTFKKGKTSKSETFSRQVKKGDTLFSLVSSIYKPESGKVRKQIYNAIQKFNPRMKSIHVILAGQNIRLPRAQLFSGGQAAVTAAAKDIPKTVEAASAPEPLLELSDYRMAVITEVLARMKGAITTTGNYYIPLPESGQITIDASRIPVVELADGSVLLLDFSRRMSPSLRKMISSHWPNHHAVTVSLNEETPIILQKAFQASRTYSMTTMQAPLEVGEFPRLQLATGWLISEANAKGERKAIQLLTFLKDRRLMLPKAVTDYARRMDLVITDVLEGHGVVNPPEIKRIDLPLPDLKNLNNMDLCMNVLNIFDVRSSRNVDMKIFDEHRDGFNLSIRADLLARHGNRQVMFHANPLPLQFATILHENGIETVLLTEGDSRRTGIEKTLAAVGISFSPNVFSFPMPQQTDKPRGIIRFPAIRVAVNQSVQYLIDSDMDQDLYQSLHQQWDIRLIRY